ncbi:MAG TPA: hypothetical protein VI958_11415, partial [Acidobacteriota bacterium]
FLPSFLNSPGMGAMMIGVLILMLLLIGPQEGVPRHSKVRLQIIFLLVTAYAGFVLLSLFLLTSIPLDGRLLSPAYALTIVFVAGSAIIFRMSKTRHAVRLRTDKKIKIVLSICLMLFFFFFCRRGIDYVTSVTGGQGFASAEWRNSPTIAAVGAGDFPGPLYTNAPALISLYTRRTTKGIPIPYTSNQRVNVHWLAEAQSLGSELRRHHGTLVMLDNIPLLEPESELELLRLASLKLVRKLPDGRIYR